jgi:hypothetical protein
MSLLDQNTLGMIQLGLVVPTICEEGSTSQAKATFSFFASALPSGPSCSPQRSSTGLRGEEPPWVGVVRGGVKEQLL